MDREDVLFRLTEIFKDVFDDDCIVLSDVTTAADIEDWDSLSHISLLSAIEDEFDVRFSMGQTVSMKNVGEMVDFLISEA